MSTFREIEQVYKDDIIRKQKMIKDMAENLGEMEGELDQSSFYEDSTYFILDAKSNAVKIGKTSQTIKEKMVSIQYGNPNKLRVIAVIEREDIEEELHLKFRRLRMRGEWFRYEGELKSFIEDLPQECNQNIRIFS